VLHLDLGLDSLGRVELAVLLEEEIGLSLSDDQVAELKTVGDLLAALEQPASTTPPAPLPGWPRSWPLRAIRALLLDAVLFPLLLRACRPLTAGGRRRQTIFSSSAGFLRGASSRSSVASSAGFSPASRLSSRKITRSASSS